MSQGRRPNLFPVRRMSLEEAAWVGAMVEAEGTVRHRVRIGGKWTEVGVKSLDQLSRADRITPHEVIVYSSDVEVISACLRLTGVGTVYYRPPRPNYRSPNGRQAFAKKDNWSWECSYADQLEQLLPQIIPYLTSKKYLAQAAIPIRGGSCHPTHLLAPPDTVHNTPEQIERNWQEFFKEDKINPRAIRRQHRWKPAHEPNYPEPDSSWFTMNLQLESPPGDPDQRDLLTGGPESGLPCSRCEEMTRIVGRMSVWDVMHQSGVQVANEKEIAESRRRELQKEFIVILACPNCRLKYQWKEAFLPRKVHRA